jgi:hypothetical protein
MARRPRPAHRPPPKTALAPAAILPSRSNTKKSVPLKRAATPDEDDEDEEDAGPDNFFVQGSSKDSGISEDDESEGGDASPEEESADERDADAPRVVQWVDDEEDEEPAEEPTVDMPGDLVSQLSLSDVAAAEFLHRAPFKLVRSSSGYFDLSTNEKLRSFRTTIRLATQSSADPCSSHHGD